MTDERHEKGGAAAFATARRLQFRFHFSLEEDENAQNHDRPRRRTTKYFKNVLEIIVLRGDMKLSQRKKLGGPLKGNTR